ncbi:MAG: hypothetical protein KatS3mg105_0324 [Gemmatales bacterium]|nr:MAG: hypothetical protein KatS3mg105_0324 [Gemmatales bacterium]
MDSSTRQLLQDVFRRESRSFMQYVRDAFPWVPEEERDALDAIDQMSKEEEEAVVELGRFLVRHRVPLPYIGTFPMSFTSFNFVSLDHLLRVLVEHQQRELNQVERDLTCISTSAYRAPVERIVEIKKRHLQELEELAAKHKVHQSEAAKAS